jgi:hypothetical protein
MPEHLKFMPGNLPLTISKVAQSNIDIALSEARIFGCDQAATLQLGFLITSDGCEMESTEM